MAKDQKKDKTKDIAKEEIEEKVDIIEEVEVEVEEESDGTEKIAEEVTVEIDEEVVEEDTVDEEAEDDSDDSDADDDDSDSDSDDDDDTEEKKEEEPKQELRQASPTGVKYSNIKNPNAFWYVVHTYSGHERKVAITLGERVHVMNLSDKINEVLIPTQKKIVVTSGKKKEIDERLFPGYILVKAEIEDNVWHVIRSTPGVTGFVGIGSQPTPLSKKEVDSIVKFMKLDTPKYETKYQEGDSVKIIDGAFKDFLGRISKVMTDQGRLEVLVSVFDRETPVEVDFAQVEAV